MKKQLLRIIILFTLFSFGNSRQNRTIAQGTLEWVKQIGGPKYEYLLSIKIDSMNNVYTMGLLDDTMDMDPGPAVYNLVPVGGLWDQDIYVSKLDASGNFLWAKRIGGPDYEQADAMQVDPTGNVYVTGTFQGTADFDPGLGVYNLSTGTTNNMDAFVFKLDPSGNFSWAKQFSSNVLYHYNEGIGVDVDASGNVYTTGLYSSTTDFDPGTGTDSLTTTPSTYGLGSDMYFSKLDPSGNFVWAKHIGGGDQVGGTALAVDDEANVAVVGYYGGTVDFDPDSTIQDMITDPLSDLYSTAMFVMKLDKDGKFVFSKKFGGGYKYFDAIATDRLGNIYTTGGFMGTVDFNPGTLEYNLTSTGGDYDYDIFICKIDSAGNFGWARKMGGMGSDIGFDIAVDVASSVYTTGIFAEDTVDFNPRSGIYNLSATGQNAYISKLQDDGTFLWAKNIGSGSGEYNFNQGLSIAVDAKANTFVGGDFIYTSDFDPGPGVFTLASVPDISGYPSQDIFVLKLHDTLSTVSVEEHPAMNENEFSLYPNPNVGEFNLGITLATEGKLIIEVVDIAGQIMKTVNQPVLNVGKNSIFIDASELSNGIYFVKIYNDDNVSTIKCLINK